MHYAAFAWLNGYRAGGSLASEFRVVAGKAGTPRRQLYGYQAQLGGG